MHLLFYYTSMQFFANKETLHRSALKNFIRKLLLWSEPHTPHRRTWLQLMKLLTDSVCKQSFYGLVQYRGKATSLLLFDVVLSNFYKELLAGVKNHSFPRLNPIRRRFGSSWDDPAESSSMAA